MSPTSQPGQTVLVQRSAAQLQREHEPLQRVDEFVAVIGRRGGNTKSLKL